MLTKLSFSGAFRPGDPDLTYRHVPFEVPAGAKRIEVSYNFTRDEERQPEHEADDVVDIGIFDTRGTEFLESGFRGWSGGSKRSFYIAREDATPSYIPGPLPAGEWNLHLSGRLLHSDVMPYWVHVAVYSDPLDGDPQEVLHADARVANVAPAGPGEGRWLRGDFHSHTVHSDGYNTVDEYAVEAQRVALDFLAITDHNTFSHFAEIDARPLRDGLLLIPGEEITTFWGHANVWGLRGWVDFRCTDDTGMQQILDWVHERGALFSPNHPKRGYPWEFAGVRDFKVCEAWQGAWRWYNEESLDFWVRRLDAGERVVTVGGSDTHSIPPARFNQPWTLGNPCTWVYASEPMTEEGILAGVRAGHVFLSEDPTGPFLELTASCEGRTYLMGDAVAAPPGTPVTFRLRYHGPPEKKLHLYRNGTLWQEVVAEQDEVELQFELPLEEPGYVRADTMGFRGRPERGEVVHAMTNPIYLEVAS